MDMLEKTITQEIQLSQLDPERQTKVLAIKDSININDEQAVANLGASVSKNITDLNKTVLKSVKVKDIPEIEAILPQLNSAFAEVDSASLLTKKQGFFGKLFKGDQVKQFVQKFENAETVVSEIQHNLERVEMELRKDIEFENQLGQRNLMYISELEDTILGMRLKLSDAMANLNDRISKADKENFVELQLIEEEKDKIDGLDKQIFWLEQQKMLAIQTLPILRNLKISNRDMVRQISMTVQQSIPAWEQGIIIAFHIHRQQGALRIERAVHDMTNQLVKQNSELLKENSIEITKAVESGMIDMETFQQANKNLIEASKITAEIKAKAMQTRAESLVEYKKLTDQLIEAEKRDLSKLMQPERMGVITDGNSN